MSHGYATILVDPPCLRHNTEHAIRVSLSVKARDFTRIRFRAYTLTLSPDGEARFCHVPKGFFQRQPGSITFKDEELEGESSFYIGDDPGRATCQIDDEPDPIPVANQVILVAHFMTAGHEPGVERAVRAQFVTIGGGGLAN